MTTAVRLALPLLVGWCLCMPATLASDSSQLDAVRSRITSLEAKLGTLEAASADAAERRQQLTTQLELAEARVRELELVLEHSRDEIVRLGDQALELSQELEARRDVVARHLEMMALLGRPGTLQLLFDAARGGDLEEAASTVAVLTAGQIHLMEEYKELQVTRRTRLAALSRRVETARQEARDLVARRQELSAFRAQVETELERLTRSQRSTESRLEELREREQALARLLKIVTAKKRLTAKEDIRRYRGALPWPAAGRVVQSFGRHYLPKYATYTVCNGVRLDVASGAEVQAVFPGVVAYARHFKGYGNMVVVDHGNGVYSLVAGLATIHVRLDQSVTMGTRLGLASPPEPEGNLYVEMRVGDRPEDPRRWLELREGQS